ncbi:early mitotic inhibitor-like protein [Saccoglossus kowalevskii]|uniref:Early mitotic inhibitor-like protein n=1 Tax=Saccoglossus kowalevskii TaxID=10224 RepID=A0ABM0GGS6_SACKO|nr:early mitotic inhibitor-like protein [Saccoglossus kowalevskii]
MSDINNRESVIMERSVDCFDSDDVFTKKRSRVPNYSPPSTMKSPGITTPDSKARRVCEYDHELEPIVKEFATLGVDQKSESLKLPGKESSVFLTPADTPDSEPQTFRAPSLNRVREFSGERSSDLRYPTPEFTHTTPWQVKKQARRSTDIPKFTLDTDSDDIVPVNLTASKVEIDNAVSHVFSNNPRNNVDMDTQLTAVGSTYKFCGLSVKKPHNSTVSIWEHGIIGRKIGLEKVDIMKELYSKTLQFLVLQYLEPVDLCNVCCVSKVWNNACISESRINKKRREYIDMIEEQKENTQVKSVHTQLMTPCDKPLGLVQMAVKPTPSDYKTPTTATKSDLFMKVAQSLFYDDTLTKCPLCESPARVLRAEQRATCTREACSNDFCTKCHTPAHGSKKCPGIKGQPVRKSQSTVGSKKSKKNLRRL